MNRIPFTKVSYPVFVFLYPGSSPKYALKHLEKGETLLVAIFLSRIDTFANVYSLCNQPNSETEFSYNHNNGENRLNFG